MSSKFISLGALLLLLSFLPAAYAHAAISPALGVKGTPKRSDAKRPTKGNPCGAGVNIASALDASTVVPAATNGEVKVTAINFNAYVVLSFLQMDVEIDLSLQWCRWIEESLRSG